MKAYSSAISGAVLAASLLTSVAAHADALPTPSMTGPLAANPNPISFDSGFGNIYVGGAISGLAMYQTNHTAGSAFGTPDHETQFDMSNGQVFIQKTDGLVQFYVQAGEYSLPALGTPYIRATQFIQEQPNGPGFGAVPVAYIKIAPLDNLSIEGGKLPTLIGAEYTFTFENLNIERGLLWNQEPAISKGAQVNYTMGPLAFSLALTDGAYTDRYNQLSGSAAWTISSSDTVSFVGGGDLGKYELEHSGPLLAPFTSESVYNLIWTHTDGPWTVTPYAQYTHVPTFLTAPATDTWGGAILANYAFDPNWSLGGRVEYIKQTGGSAASYTLLYGKNSSAWSITVTPTYQYKLLFARADLSYVTIGSLASGFGFGTTGTKSDQFRALLEIGIVF